MARDLPRKLVALTAKSRVEGAGLWAEGVQIERSSPGRQMGPEKRWPCQRGRTDPEKQ